MRIIIAVCSILTNRVRALQSTLSAVHGNDIIISSLSSGYRHIARCNYYIILTDYSSYIGAEIGTHSL